MLCANVRLRAKAGIGVLGLMPVLYAAWYDGTARALGIDVPRGAFSIADEVIG